MISMRWKAFIHGMGSVLCLFPARYQVEFRTPRYSDVSDDARAIAGDFKVVGMDIARSMQSHDSHRRVVEKAEQLELFQPEHHAETRVSSH
jgi:hypothetical protein